MSATRETREAAVMMQALLRDRAIEYKILDLYELLASAEDIVVDDAAMTLLQEGIDETIDFVKERQKALDTYLIQISHELFGTMR